MINWRIVIQVVSLLIILLGVFMLSALPVSMTYKSGDHWHLFFSGLITCAIGVTGWFLTRNAPKTLAKKEGFLIVSTGWLCISLLSSLPYLFSGIFDHPVDAIFESVSGLTTTGASALTDIESVSKGILYWRSLSQWIGGMGIIVLTVALFPLLGIGGVELFVAESPGPTSDKIHPRIKETAKRFWLIYAGLTCTLIALLTMTKMDFYDAINHGLTTMATGGFSTRNASIAHFDSRLIEGLITVFMFIAGINYTILYYSLMGRFKRVFESDEFKTYIMIVLSVILVATTAISLTSAESLGTTIVHSAFQVVSMITTTGFVVIDYTAWTPFITLLFFFLLFIGACAGSTAGGIKIIRHLVFFRNSFLELKRLLHPKAIIRTKIDKKLVSPRVITHIMVFLLLYLLLFVIGTISMSLLMTDFDQPLISAVGAVATSLGNVGPAIGELGPMDNFAAISYGGKMVLVMLMIMGRLELLSVLILFTPYFWRTN